MNKNFNISSKLNGAIPQGSTLGLPLFSLYINYLINCTSVTPFLSADDTSLSFNATSTTKLIDEIDTKLNKVFQWMKANKLCINAQKSTAPLIPRKSNLKIHKNN